MRTEYDLFIRRGRRGQPDSGPWFQRDVFTSLPPTTTSAFGIGIYYNQWTTEAVRPIFVHRNDGDRTTACTHDRSIAAGSVATKSAFQVRGEDCSLLSSRPVVVM